MISLSFIDTLPALALSALILFELVNGYLSKAWFSIYKPTIFVGIIVAYYCLYSPVLYLAFSQSAYYRGMDHSPFLFTGWTAALLFYVSMLFGYYLCGDRVNPKRFILNSDKHSYFKLGLIFCIVGLAAFFLFAGFSVFAMINPLSASSSLETSVFKAAEGSAFGNYLLNLINLVIPGILLIFISFLRTRKRLLPLLVILVILIISTGIFVSLGFRFRLVLLFAPILLIYHVFHKSRVPVVLISSFAVALIVTSSFIASTRSYGLGLNLDSLSQSNSSEIPSYLATGEEGVFLTSSGVLSITPSERAYVGLAPFYNLLLFPVPRVLYAGKPNAEYLFDSVNALYGKIYSPGAAYLAFVEWYLIAGWSSLVFFSFLLGYFLRRLWSWYLWRLEEPLAQVIYFLTTSYLYLFISRGYIAQTVFAFLFTVYPLFWLYGRLSKPVVSREAPPSLPRG